MERIVWLVICIGNTTRAVATISLITTKPTHPHLSSLLDDLYFPWPSKNNWRVAPATNKIADFSELTVFSKYFFSLCSVCLSVCRTAELYCTQTRQLRLEFCCTLREITVYVRLVSRYFSHSMNKLSLSLSFVFSTILLYHLYHFILQTFHSSISHSTYNIPMEQVIKPTYQHTY